MAKATVRTDSWDTVYTYLQTTNAISTNNIYSAYNSQLISDVGYPIVIIFPPDVERENLSLNGACTMDTVSIRIDVYEDNAEQCKSLADEVTDKLNAGQATFSAAGLNNMRITSPSYDTFEEGQKKVHIISVTVEFIYAS